MVAVPTICGTGSEVTNISVLYFKEKHTKKGFVNDALYADSAVLLPELLANLPMHVFSASSIDAMIHAVESWLSPKATATTKLLSVQALEMILDSYQKIVAGGLKVRGALLPQFLLASNYAGIAFSIAGCTAVHALSYPLGRVYHIAHGESNYAIFLPVM